MKRGPISRASPIRGEGMAGADDKRSFQTLDGLRAIGAFLVVARHVPFLFGGAQVPESFLAVDLFYLVSGFVVAHAYRERLERGGFVKAFILTRWIRLYPLYACGMALGLVCALWSVKVDPGGWWTPQKVEIAIAAGLFMFPMLPGMPSSGASLDGPTWTLAPELIANFVFAAVAKRMTPTVLALLCVVFGGGLIWVERAYGSLDIGFGPNDFGVALIRVGFSFSLGLLLRALLGTGFRVRPLLAWIALAILFVLLAYTPAPNLKPVFELAVVCLGFPLLVILAARAEPDAVSGRVFSFLGLMSYGVYLLHQPMGNLIRIALDDRLDIPDGLDAAPYALSFCALLVFVAWRLDKTVDGPVRAWLRHRLLKPSKS